MAGSGRTGTGRSSSRSSKSSSSKKPARTTSSSHSTASRSSSSRKRTTTPAPQESGASEVVKKFASSKVAKPLIFIAAVLLITGIDLLVSWDKFELFFKILGIEVLAAAIVWIILTLVFSSKKNMESDGEPLEDEV